MQKYIIGIGALALLFCTNAHALETDIGADYYITPNPHLNTHRDGWGGHVRLLGRFFRDDFKWFAEGATLQDIEYRSGAPVYERYGDMSGYTALGGLVFEPRINFPLKPFLTAGAGAGVWSFHESPLLQDENIVIGTELSLVTRVTGGLLWKFSDTWKARIESGWWQTKIPVTCSDDGIDCRLPDDSPTGLEFIPVSVDVRYEF
jgi:hypothetical protein